MTRMCTTATADHTPITGADALRLLIVVVVQAVDGLGKLDKVCEVAGEDVGYDVPIDVRVVMNKNIAEGNGFLQACRNLRGDNSQLCEAFKTFPHRTGDRQLRLTDDVRGNIHTGLHGTFQIQRNNVLKIVVHPQHIWPDWPLGFHAGDAVAQ